MMKPISKSFRLCLKLIPLVISAALAAEAASSETWSLLRRPEMKLRERRKAVAHIPASPRAGRGTSVKTTILCQVYSAPSGFRVYLLQCKHIDGNTSEQTLGHVLGGSISLFGLDGDDNARGQEEYFWTSAGWDLALVANAQDSGDTLRNDVFWPNGKRTWNGSR